MVLLRGAGAPAPGVRAQLNTIVHLHTRLAVSPRFMLCLQPAPAAPMLLRQAAPGIAAHPVAGSPSVAGMALQLPAPPAALLLPRTAAARAAATEAQAALQVAATRPHAQEPRSVSAPAAPAVNVESLTSLVIQQIDRRLVAYRERMGRV